MSAEHVFLDLAIVVTLAAGLSWVALMLRQPIILGYILCGVLAGPWGLSLVRDVAFIDQVGRIGIALLLFLAGLVLHPQKLVQLFRQTALVTLGNCLTSLALAGGFALLWGFTLRESLWVGLALMFSSTILVVKLMPTTALHHKHMGAVCIAILIAEDMVAVVTLLLAAGVEAGGVSLVLIPAKAVLLVAFVMIVERTVVRRMMRTSDRFHEMLYLLSLGWCFGVAMLAEALGLSIEVGAFVAGVALARSPVSLFLSQGLRPFRDFFLVLFFFALGAKVDLLVARAVLFPALLLGGMILLTKPFVVRWLLRKTGESREFAAEGGVRLGQASEFSLVVAYFTFQSGLIGGHAAQLVQLATLLTMIVSSYIVVFRFPTPLGRGRLQQD